jgi:predicted phosphodiesterase
MYRIAAFSDVHGNLPALQSVLNAIDIERPDAIFCLGDLIDFAPWPNEVIELIRSRNICTLMGNHDQRIAFDLETVPLAKHRPMEREARALAIDWSRRVVTESHKRFLANLPESINLAFGPVEHPHKILFVHASTRGLDEYIYEDHPEEDLRHMFTSIDPDVIVMGHTHLPYVRRLTDGAKTVVNVGSVGRSKEASRMPSFAILNIEDSRIEAKIHRVSYDVERTIAAIRESLIPDFYAEFLAAPSLHANEPAQVSSCDLENKPSP